MEKYPSYQWPQCTDKHNNTSRTRQCSRNTVHICFIHATRWTSNLKISHEPPNQPIDRRSWNLRSMDIINTFARLVLASWPQRRFLISNSGYQRLSGVLSIYTVARVYSLLSSLSSCFLSLSDHRVLSGEGYIPRNFRVVSTVIGKRLIGERPALIMTVESARLEASSRAWRRATPSRLSLHGAGGPPTILLWTDPWWKRDHAKQFV